ICKRKNQAALQPGLHECPATLYRHRFTGRNRRISCGARSTLSRPGFFSSIADPPHARVSRRGRSDDRQFAQGKTRGNLVSRIFSSRDGTRRLFKKRHAAHPLDWRWPRPSASFSIVQAGERSRPCLQFADRGACLDASFHHCPWPRNLACADAIISQEASRLRCRHDTRRGIPPVSKHVDARRPSTPARAYDRGPLNISILIGTIMPFGIAYISEPIAQLESFHLAVTWLRSPLVP